MHEFSYWHVRDIATYVGNFRFSIKFGSNGAQLKWSVDPNRTFERLDLHRRFRKLNSKDWGPVVHRMQSPVGPNDDKLGGRDGAVTYRSFVWLASLLAGLATISGAPAATMTGDAAVVCAALAGNRDAVSIDSAALQQPSELAVSERGPTPAARIAPANPAFCKVLGHIEPTDPKAPPIRFQVNLPVGMERPLPAIWRRRLQRSLITRLGLPPAYPFDRPAPLARGFVTYATDLGHETKPGEPPQVFALNDEAFENFAHRSYKKVRDAAVALMLRAYGKPPQKLYFMGSSEGGREALTMAQRYPDDFDGIFARVPVINWVGLQHAGTRSGL